MRTTMKLLAGSSSGFANFNATITCRLWGGLWDIAKRTSSTRGSGCMTTELFGRTCIVLLSMMYFPLARS